jgi:predicted DsbA family dithiol-disulfide isomerase
MRQKLKIDFVSDIACPWCVIGLGGLDQALGNLRDTIEADIVFHPFELNPQMPAGGQSTLEHVAQKYGMAPDQIRASRELIRTRAAEVGFTMNSSDASRIYNTFDAHRLLAWAQAGGRQHALKDQLFILYFTEQTDPGNHDALVAAAEKAGLDPAAALAVLKSDRYAEEVRADEAFWRGKGINAVPSVIVNDRYLISGGQPAQEFERQLRQIASAPPP